MNQWINSRIDKASWPSFAIWFVVLFGFASWAFNSPSPWTTALAASDGTLPETQTGFPPTEPQRSLDLLEDAKGAYLLWQVIDIPYAIMNLMATSIAMALGLRAIGLGATPLRYLLALPVIYFICEVVENSLVSLFAMGMIATAEPVVLIQQLATTIKMASGVGGMAIGLLCLIVALLLGGWRLIKK